MRWLKKYYIALMIGLSFVLSCEPQEDVNVTTENNYIKGRVIEGMVIDRLYEIPLSQVTLFIKETGELALTDEQGRFTLVTLANDRDFVTLRVSKQGYLVTDFKYKFDLYRYRGVVIKLTPIEVDLQQVKRYLAKLQEGRDHRDSLLDPALSERAKKIIKYGLYPKISSEGVLRKALQNPPDTIRIWRRSIYKNQNSCDPGVVEVIPFEDYVKGVLPNEWIASWPSESLKAGAVAVRSYAWGWILAGGKYDCADLDDTTWSQVYNETRHPNTNAAVDATRSEAVVCTASSVICNSNNMDVPFRAEYSAENSSPTAYGVDDPPCEGQTRRGHGRGMCQWGTYRWAQATWGSKEYVWMVEHYYPGATVVSPGEEVPQYDAIIVSYSYPDQMVSGERVEAWVEYQNTGSATWDSSVRIGTTEPRDRSSNFYDPQSWISPSRPASANTTPPQSYYRFRFYLLAPQVSEPTTYTEHFALVHEGDRWFGPADNALSFIIRVNPHPHSLDNDGDGYSELEGDCNDNDNLVFPGAQEICGDGIDQNCDGLDLDCFPEVEDGSIDSGVDVDNEVEELSEDVEERDRRSDDNGNNEHQYINYYMTGGCDISLGNKSKLDLFLIIELLGGILVQQSRVLLPL